MGKHIYVTYTKTLSGGVKTRFAVECKNISQVNEVGYDLNSQADVSNIRINLCGRNLPCEFAIDSYDVYFLRQKLENA